MWCHLWAKYFGRGKLARKGQKKEAKDGAMEVQEGRKPGRRRNGTQWGKRERERGGARRGSDGKGR